VTNLIATPRKGKTRKKSTIRERRELKEKES